MLGKVTLRTKLLIGAALLCAGWIIMMPDTSQTIEPVRGLSAETHAVKAAPSGRRSPIMNASFSMSDRIVKDTTAASLFLTQSWYVAPPAPPAPMVVQAPSAPTAPPLPFAYMGTYRPEGAVPTYFLTSGDRVYDVKIGDTLDNTTAWMA